MSKVGFLDKMFNKTIMLRPTPEGVLEPMDITGFDKVFLNKHDIEGNVRVVEMKPTRIYQVRGMKGIKRLCIHLPDTTQLVDLYEPVQNPGLSESMLAVLLDIAEDKGRKEAQGAAGSVTENIAKYLRVCMILSAGAALIGVLIYFK